MSTKQGKTAVHKKKKTRDFRDRDEWTQDELLSTLWCDTCNEGNLGVLNPQEYEVKGVVYLEGVCTQCGEPVVATIADD